MPGDFLFCQGTDDYLLTVGLHVDAFQMEKAKMSIKYQTDDKGNLYIEKGGWTQEPQGRKEVKKKVEHKR